MVGLIPEPQVLLSKETSDTFYALLKDIRGADTDRELLLYIERLFDAHREYRELFSLLEREAAKKLREFGDIAAREATERRDRVSHIDQPQERGGA